MTESSGNVFADLGLQNAGQELEKARKLRMADPTDNGSRLALEMPPALVRENGKVINVAQVTQLSPSRYPGGKTWLVPEVRSWIRSLPRRPDTFVEPFAGGAMAGLTAAAETLSERVFLSELDCEVAAVWQTIFDGSQADLDWLLSQILSFQVTLENVLKALNEEPRTRAQRAFRTIIKNRMQRGGIMAAGAGLVKEGEAGKGLRSRWYPETLVERIKVLRGLRSVVVFQQMDAFDAVDQFLDSRSACFFFDPPYTAGGKNAGRRLYSHNEVNHSSLFSLMAAARGPAMLTYDDAPEVREMAASHGFQVKETRMKNTHHEVICELLILKP